MKKYLMDFVLWNVVAVIYIDNHHHFNHLFSSNTETATGLVVGALATIGVQRLIRHIRERGGEAVPS